MKLLTIMIALNSLICSFSLAADSNLVSSPSPAFLSSKKREKGVYEYAIDRLDIERARTRHGSNLQIQTIAAGGNHLIKLAKTGVKHICTGLNCTATKEQKSFAKKNWQEVKREGFSAAKANQKHANAIMNSSVAKQNEIYKDIKVIQDAKRKGKDVSHEYENRYNSANNRQALHVLSAEKSIDWSLTRHRSRMARKP